MAGDGFPFGYLVFSDSTKLNDVLKYCQNMLYDVKCKYHNRIIYVFDCEEFNAILNLYNAFREAYEIFEITTSGAKYRKINC